MKRKLFASILALTMCGTGLSALAAEELAVQDETTTEMAEEAVTPAQGDGVEVTAPQEEQDIAAEDGAETITVQDDETAPNIVESGTCGEHAAWILDEDGTLTISGTGDTDANTKWKPYLIEKVIIEEGITSIAERLFEEANMRSIQIPDSVTTIGAHAFERCLWLKEIRIPKNVSSLDGSAFDGGGTMTTIAVDPENPKFSSRNGVLYNKDRTVLVRVPAGTTGSYRMPDSVRTMGNDCMEYCDNLTSVKLSKKLRTIQANAMTLCTKLKKLSLPASVRTIDPNSFYGCTSLTSYTVAKENRNYCSVNGVLFRKDQRTLVSYPAGKTGSYTVPKGVTRIGDYAFNGRKKLSKITLPSTLKEIGAYSFGGCTKLKTIALPKHLNSIGDRAFIECYRIKNMTIPKSVTTFGEQSIGYVYDEDASSDDIFVGYGFVLYGKPGSAANVYADENRIPFHSDLKISGVKLTSRSAGKLTVTWDMNSKLSGYQVHIYEGKYGRHPQTVDTTANKITISDLNGGKRYYVSVCGVQTYEGKNYDTAWTKTKYLKIKR